jgi:endonuclease YncB( thermonuclease family)
MFPKFASIRSFNLFIPVLLAAPVVALGTAPAQAVTCASFTTQAEAQAYMQRYGATKLDGDRDGVACESLPRGTSNANTSNPGAAPTGSYKVLSVGDGDTLRVSQGNSAPMTVRLACIDAPEMSQAPYGPASSQRLKQLLPVGQTVSLQVRDTDRYGRKVAEISRNGRSVNLQMVSEGQAVVYRSYLGNCSTTLQSQLVQAEAKAQQQRLGFWQQNNPVLPEIYRRNARN